MTSLPAPLISVAQLRELVTRAQTVQQHCVVVHRIVKLPLPVTPVHILQLTAV